MWIENSIFREDLKYIINTKFINWNNFENKTIFVTGGTGLIGFYVINSLLYYNQCNNSNITVIALVRDLEKAKGMYKKQLEEDSNHLKFVIGTVEMLPVIENKINFILHGAGPTASAFFVEHPVETIKISLKGMINILELAKDKQISNMVYLSSMEVYGDIQKHEKINEDHASNLTTMKARNSYPESKRICENLCSSYYSEYNVPVNCIRLTQTFGPGINYNDKRVFALFIRSLLENKDITLLTAGKTCRNYLYLADAATAILKILSSDKKNQIYNAANEETYCSIKGMAELVANDIAQGKIKINIQLGKEEQIRKFMPEIYIDLDTSKLRELGWNSCFNLKDMYERTIASLK